MRETGRNGRGLPGAALAAVLALASGCASGSSYVWVDRLPPPKPQADSEYRISPGDVISVNVWNQDGISVPRARVREDGKISMTFLQDVEVAGMTAAELATRLQGRLKAFIVSPVVTVRLEEVRPIRISVVGEVARQGTYDLEPGSGVLRALAAAGGLTDYAKRDGIYVLRQARPGETPPPPSRIRFRYEALTRGETRAAGFPLHDRDVVVVE